MGIVFSESDWSRIQTTYAKWWRGELDRPLFNVSVSGYEPGRNEPEVAPRPRTAHFPPEVTADQIVDCWDYSLSCTRFPGDSFPAIWPDFGPGVLAAFLGARPEVALNTVWFHAPAESEISDIHLRDVQHPWVQRIDSIIQAALKRWGSQVLLATTDLGGTLDVLSSFRPSERLLFDLYDHPEQVKRLTEEIHEQWWRFFHHFEETAQTGRINRGYSAWTHIYSAEPYYMLQCDLSYTLSPQMFDEFVKPELARSCAKLKNAFYHLDGIGELPHLDSLLSIPQLKGIQWIPGDGQPSNAHWPDVYRRIRAAGKLVQVFLPRPEGLDIIDILADQVGSAKGIIVIGNISRDQEENLMRKLEKYGAA